MQLSAYVQIYDYHLLESSYEDYLSQIAVLSEDYGPNNIPFKTVLSAQEWKERVQDYQRLTKGLSITENTSFFVQEDDLNLELLLKSEGGSFSVEDLVHKRTSAINEFKTEYNELIDFLLKNALSFNLDFGLVRSSFR